MEEWKIFYIVPYRWKHLRTIDVAKILVGAYCICFDVFHCPFVESKHIARSFYMQAHASNQCQKFKNIQMVEGPLIELKNALFQAMIGGSIRKEVWSFDYVLC